MRITSVSNHVSRPSQAPGKAPEKEESLRVVPQFDASLDYTKKALRLRIIPPKAQHTEGNGVYQVKATIWGGIELHGNGARRRGLVFLHSSLLCTSLWGKYVLLVLCSSVQRNERR